MHTEQQYIGRVTGIRTPLIAGPMGVLMGFSGVFKDILSLGIIYGLAGAFLLAGFLIILPLNRSTGNDKAPDCPATEKM